MIKNFLTAGILSAAMFIPAVAAETDAMSGSTVLLDIDGKKITAAEFEQRRPNALFHARNTYFEAQKKALTAFIDDYLLEREAQKESITVDELLNRHVYSTIEKDPSDEALRVYYEGLDATEPFEAVKDKILDHLRQIRKDKAKAAYMKNLKANAKAILQVTQPRAPLTLGEVPVRGDVNAPIMIVEYADYECPYCQQAQPIIDKIEAEYKGKVAFMYKDTPLPMHPHAQKAAEAAHCAGNQSKFWEFHDSLFETKQLELAQLKEAARTLKMDGAAFDKCLDSGQYADLVKKQVDEAITFQIEGTPSFFINGRFFSGGLSYEQFKAIVDEEYRAFAGKSVETSSR